MTTSGGRSADARRLRRGPAQYLLGLLLALAIGASIAMIFSPTRSIVASLAVIAALWAAVIGAILVTKFRRQADSAEAKARDLRLVYELQLEREITARRQYELGVEAQIRKEVRAESNEELHELQAQVAALRASLELLVGELPEQRVALPTERRLELEHARGSDADDGAVAERDFASTARDDRTPPAPGPDVPAFVDETPTDEWAVAAAPSPIPGTPTPPGQAPIPAPPAPAAPSTPWRPQASTPRRPEVAVPSAPESQPEPEPASVSASGSGRHGRSGATGAVRTPEPQPASQPTAEPAPAGEPEPAQDPAATNVADTTAAWDTSAASRGRDRHRAPETEPGAHANGRSVSELIEQFRAPTPGGRRRRQD